MGRHKFVNRKQREDESLEQFWHALNGLAAYFDFGTQPTGLVYDFLVSNINNTVVQEKFFTDTKVNQEDALKFAVAFERGAHRSETICVNTTNLPVFAVEKSNECYKDGEKPFVA